MQLRSYKFSSAKTFVRGQRGHKVGLASCLTGDSRTMKAQSWSGCGPSHSLVILFIEVCSDHVDWRPK